MNKDLMARLLPEMGFFESVLESIEWAEDEIERMMRKHGEAREPGKPGHGPIWRSFNLLKGLALPDGKIPAEFVCRAHYRELLQRVVDGADTRPATDAEMILVMMQTSQVAPMTSAATCLYMRVFSRAFPDHADHIKLALDLDAYESVHGRVADEHEAYMRSKLAKPDRIHKDKLTTKANPEAAEEEDAA